MQDFEKIAENDLKELGDILTLDPAVVKSLVKENKLDPYLAVLGKRSFYHQY